MIVALLLGAAAFSGCAAAATGPPDAVTGTVAAVRGQVASDTGGEVEYWAEYGPTTAYGSETEHQTETVEANTPRTVFVDITGLERATTYHYRLCARDGQQQGGPRCGEDMQFTTVNVDCGDTLTADLRLSGDLDCFRTNQDGGLSVGAHGIDVDLAGHAVIATFPAGVENTGGYDDVTIRNGRLETLGPGISLAGASRNRIVDITATLFGSDFRSGGGIKIEGGEDNVVRASRMAGEGNGLSVVGSPRLLVAGSEGFARFGWGMSIRAELARVRDSYATSDLGGGLIVQGSGNRIRRTRASGVVGIEIFSGAGNVVAESFGGGIARFGGSTPSEGDGIFVDAQATDTLLRANVANGNDGDGIQTQSPSTRLRDNTTNDNRDFGIEAVAGVIDLGGNTASGNGNPLQCLNVVCQ